MDNSFDQQKNQTSPRISFSPIIAVMLGALKKINQFFSLTDEEKTSAGICVGSRQPEIDVTQKDELARTRE